MADDPVAGVLEDSLFAPKFTINACAGLAIRVEVVRATPAIRRLEPNTREIVPCILVRLRRI